MVNAMTFFRVRILRSRLAHYVAHSAEYLAMLHDAYAIREGDSIEIEDQSGALVGIVLGTDTYVILDWMSDSTTVRLPIGGDA